MATKKKFDYRLVESEGTWTAEITRRKTARETIVSKSQSDLATEEAAKTWAETELKVLVEALAARNKRDAANRTKPSE